MDIPLKAMEEGYVGTLNSTFEDREVHGAMKAYLYCVVILILSTAAEKQRDDGGGTNHGSTRVIVDPGVIRGCDEIERIWYNNLYDIPLHRYFADDSLWLTMLLDHYEQVFRSQITTTVLQQ